MAPPKTKHKEFRRNQRVYLQFVMALLLPGREVPVLPADRTQPEDIDEWSDDELALMIEEGRRQSDRQIADLSGIRGRAQWLFTAAVGALAALAAELGARDPGTWVSLVWLLGLIVLTYGIAGAASVMVSRADFSAIHTAVLSGVGQPVKRSLAQAYSRMMPTGENTVATRLTVFRQAVVFCLIGGYIGLITAIASR
jgi:hypothetical protein